MDVHTRTIGKDDFFTNKKNIFILAIVCTALWGSAFPIIKIEYEVFNINGVDLYSKLLFAGVRFTFAGIIVLIHSLITKKKFPKFYWYLFTRLHTNYS